MSTFMVNYIGKGWSYSPRQTPRRDDGQGSEARTIEADTPQEAGEIAKQTWLTEQTAALGEGGLAANVFYTDEPHTIVLQLVPEQGNDDDDDGDVMKFLSRITEINFATGEIKVNPMAAMLGVGS